MKGLYKGWVTENGRTDGTEEKLAQHRPLSPRQIHCREGTDCTSRTGFRPTENALDGIGRGLGIGVLLVHTQGVFRSCMSRPMHGSTLVEAKGWIWASPSRNPLYNCERNRAVLPSRRGPVFGFWHGTAFSLGPPLVDGLKLETSVVHPARYSPINLGTICLKQRHSSSEFEIIEPLSGVESSEVY